jgi:hypothetical protein
MNEEIPQPENVVMRAVNLESKVRLYNNTLCPLIWNDKTLKDEVRVNLLKIAKDFYEKTSFKAPIIDINLMGSVANFNWTPESDLDVHILIDFNQLKTPIETAEQIVKSASSQWNVEHNIIIKGHKVELNIQPMTDTKPHVTGIYSLVKNQWIRTPKRETLSIDKPKIKNKYQELKDYINSAISTSDRDYMKSVKKYIDKYRQYGLDIKGELSNENIVFKLLRSTGIISKLKDAVNKVYDDELSIKEKNMNEIRDKDIKSRYPQPHQGYEFDDLSKLTLDNLKSLKYKLRSFIKGSEHDEDKSDFNYYVGEFKKYDAEIKRRLKYINAPVAVKQVKEVNEKDIKSRYPQPHQQDKKRWFDDFSKLSLDNLKSLRSKAARSYLWAIKNKDKEEWAWYDQQFFNYDDEIKRRMRKINAPVAKMKEGYGAGKPEDDRLHIPDHRWQIRSKDAPKTPKMVNEMPNMSLKGRIFI